MIKDDFAIYLFSYNRGIYLENCLNSLSTCADGIDVTVIDDNSDETYTCEVLENYRSKFRLLKPERSDSKKAKLGGLYSNMHKALDDGFTRGKKYAIFIQDDMQFVRNVEENDLSIIEEYFNKNTDSAQLQCCFFKKLESEVDRKFIQTDDGLPVYLRDLDHPICSSYSDVGVFFIERFYSLFEKLETTEKATDSLGREKGIRLGQMVNPFMMWLPYPKSYRHGGRTFRNFMIETIAECDFYPYYYMTNEEIHNLKSRPKLKLPLAEDWLQSAQLKNTNYWSFSGGVINLFARGGLREKIAKSLWKLG
jgi:hypothetical protein